MAPKETEKKGGLTLEKLTLYDDVITDALVDKVYFWTSIRKNRGGRFSGSRGVGQDEITKILRAQVIMKKDVNEAMQELVQLSGLRKFMASLKDDKDREQFRRHLRRYVSIYMPDCPFEVTTTNRYTITDHEASITARRDIQPREEIKYLTGVQVAMTEEQEKTLELARRDFSLVISSRKKTRSLFLGPARFANHDCDANAKLSTKGYDGMQIVAVKPILEGEEITVSYGEDYFGEDNEECLCHTCEDRQINGWAPYKREDDEDEEDSEEEAAATSKSQENSSSQEETHSLRKKRKHGTANEEAVPNLKPSKRAKFEPKTKLANKKREVKQLQKAAADVASDASALVQEMPVSSIEDPVTNLTPSSQISREIRSQKGVGLLELSIDDLDSSRNNTPQSSMATGSPKSTQSTDATSVDEDPQTAGTNHQKIKVDPDIINAHPSLGVVTVKDEVTMTTPAWASLFAGDSLSELSELSDTQDLNDELQQVVKRSKRKRSKTPTAPRNTRSISRNAAHNRAGTPVPEHTLEEGWVANTRKPGDYMTSRSRLSSKDSKWVECQTCEEDFVQKDGHLGTRKECPRCERHSMLYGYPWPKTEKEGKHDKEERVLDPRSIHRFVDPEEEKQIKKEKPKRKFKIDIMERFSTPRSHRDSSTSLDPDSGRLRKRVRKTM